MADELGVQIKASTLLDAWQVVVRRRWLVLGFTVAVASVAGVVSASSTPYYAATAQVVIQPKGAVILEGVTDVAPQVNPFRIEEYLRTQHRVMKSTVVGEEAARRLRDVEGINDFDGAKFPGSAVRSLMKVEPVSGTYLVNVNVEYTDPVKAATIANVLAESYTDHNMNLSLQEIRKALSYLQEQQEIYRERWLESLARVEEFKGEHGLVAVRERTAVESNLETLQQSWAGLRAERVRADAKVSALESRFKRGELDALAESLAVSDTTMGSLLVKKRELSADLGALLTRYKEGHPDVIRLESERALVMRQIEGEVRVRLQSQRADVGGLEEQEAQLAEEIARVRKEKSDQASQIARLALLEKEAEKNGQFFLSLDERMTEVGLQQFVQSNNVYVVERAIARPARIRPQVTVDLLTGVAAGMLAGVLLAFLLEFLDVSVTNIEDLALATGVPALGTLPLVSHEQVKALGSVREQHLLAYSLPRSSLAESFRTVRTGLQFREAALPSRAGAHRLLVTSSTPREGKSFVSCNLAAVLAMGGKRVLLIDGDLRRPSVHERFEFENGHGLSDVLLGLRPWRELVVASHVPGVDVMVAGRASDNPGELLSVGQIDALLDSITGYDHIVIDSPPLAAVSDALVLARSVDGVVFVVEAYRTNAKLAEANIVRLKEAGATIFGTIVNMVDPRHRGNRYGYYYDYGSYGGYTNLNEVEAAKAARS